jgi:hypothetical protein
LCTENIRNSWLAFLTPGRINQRIRSVIDQVEVDDAEIRIIGRKSVLERLLMIGGGLRECGEPLANGGLALSLFTASTILASLSSAAS